MNRKRADLTKIVLTMTDAVSDILQVLNAIPDQDTFFDVTDYLEELGMERITQRHMNRKGADLDLLAQFQQYDVSFNLF